MTGRQRSWHAAVGFARHFNIFCSNRPYREALLDIQKHPWGRGLNGFAKHLCDTLLHAGFIKAAPVEGKVTEEMDRAIRQWVSRAVASNRIVDIFVAVDLKTPNLGVLDEEFLAELRDLPQKNLALEMLRKLLNAEIKVHARRNVVQARSFAAVLEETIKRYQNRSLETAQVINELIRSSGADEGGASTQ